MHLAALTSAPAAVPSTPPHADSADDGDISAVWVLAGIATGALAVVVTLAYCGAIVPTSQ